MKALSRCKGSVLAGVLAAVLSGVFHGSALADACPAQDFGKFLNAFSSDADTAQRFTVTTPSRSTLAPYSEPGSLAPRIARVNRSDLIPMLAGMPTQAGKGVEVQKVDATRTRVVDKRAGSSNIKVFNFVRKSCWMLEGIEDWSIDEKYLPPAQSSTRSDAENRCFRRGEAFVALAGKPQYPLSKDLFETALDNYVCAAASGDPQASLAAAELSLSGMAPQLQTPQVEALFKAAATTLADGASGLSTFYCYGNVTVSEGPCQRPELAEKALIRAASMGSVDATHYLAYSFETGLMVTKDAYRALACYRLAADKGSKIAVSNLARLQALVIDDSTPRLCY